MTTESPPLSLPVFANQDELRPSDFQLLARPFLEAIAFLFPAGLEPGFLAGDAPPPEPDAEHYSLLVPLPLPESFGEGGIALRLRTTEEKLARSLSDDWLMEQGLLATRILTQVRLAFVDSESGLYNPRALAAALRDSAGSFFLVQTGSLRKSLSESLQHCAETANLLRQCADGALFACGYGLFAVLGPEPLPGGNEGSEEQRLELARKAARLLQRRLKQAGLNRAQIVYMHARRAAAIFTENGLAGFEEYLNAADRQGPFGTSCGEGDSERRVVRFRLADNEVFRSVQHKWQGQSVFGMAIFQLDRPLEASTWEWVSQVEVNRAGPALWLDDPQTLVCFFAGLTPEETAARAETIRAAIVEAFPEAVISVGVAGFPCLDYAKKYTPANCFKALMHARLLGPGQLVVFDQLTLNVSGDSFFEEGNYLQAMHEYRRGLRLKPDDVNLLNSLGVALAAYGQEAQATDCFRRVLALEARNHMALANLGYILLKAGKNVEALAFLEQAKTAFPEDEPPPLELLKALTQLHLDQRRFAKAQAVLEEWRANRDIGKDALYHRQLGLVMKGEGKMTEAMRALEQALKLAPQDAIAMSHLGELYRLTGEGKDLGLHFCQQAVRLKWDKAELWRILAESYLDCGSPEAAGKAIEHCLHLKRADARAMWLAAQVCLQKKNISQARYWLNRARKLHTISDDMGERIAHALAALPKATRKRKKKRTQAGEAQASRNTPENGQTTDFQENSNGSD